MEKMVYIIDDDSSIRDSLGLLLGLHGYRISFFADAESFLKLWKVDWSGCLMVDIRMPGMSGIELIQRLRERGSSIPVVVITGHGDVNSAREAFKANAVDFLEKPLSEKGVLEALEDAMSKVHMANTLSDFSVKVRSLTPREREVMHLLIAGHDNRAVGDALGISVRTVEVHRARVLSKTGAATVTKLVRLYLSQDGDGESL